MIDTGEWANEVRLVGRVSGSGQERELPSGDEVVSLRIVVPRTGRSPRRTTASVDTIDVACWTTRLRRTARGLADGDVVQVEGSLRRRFFHTGAGAASRYEVEAVTLHRVRSQGGTDRRSRRASGTVSAAPTGGASHRGRASAG
ncbi:single-stranded DNA-binding protein [Phycicoccus ginsengisoli]